MAHARYCPTNQKAYTIRMKARSPVKAPGLRLPLIIEKDESGWYVVECPLFQGCYTQGKTIDEALKNIREVIELIAEEEGARRIALC